MRAPFQPINSASPPRRAKHGRVHRWHREQRFGTRKDDVEFEFDASFDYAPVLSSLSVPTLAIAFAGDEVNPRAVSAARRLAAKPPELVQYELIAENETPDGHRTLRQVST